MQLIHEVRPGTSFLLADLGTIRYVPTLIPTHNGRERSDIMEMEFSWSGMTGGAANNIVAARARGYAAGNTGIAFGGTPVAPTPADVWDMGRILVARNFAGVSLQANGEFLDGNTLLAGRGVTQFVAWPGAGQAMLDPVVIVAVILTGGTAFTGGSLVFERISFYNSRLSAAPGGGN